ncbi:MAG TPA: cytochrome c [Pyrinomonadaceae bacterium]|nr:cytochrome c [Pyrinomonadaceae bacterium]
MLKKVAVGLVIIPVLGLLVLSAASRPSSAAPADDFDAAATYKAKCQMCHTATASKFFDTSKTEEQMVEAILKGVKGEKPPAMPAFEAKGITAEQAKALETYMRSIKQ